MKKSLFIVQDNKKLTSDIFLMTLDGDTSAITHPGQFINIKLDGFYLRRPMSVCDWDSNTIKIIYKIVGGGTEYMAELTKGTSLDVLSGLGNGFFVNENKNPLLVGGGVGIPPLYGLAKQLIKLGQKPTAILGFKSKSDMILTEEFNSLGIKTIITTEDGSFGIKGYVCEGMKEIEYDYIYTCGPAAMMQAVYNKSTCDGQYSFEERMACGFGACMGCSCKTMDGYKRICKEGPVLKRGEILW